MKLTISIIPTNDVGELDKCLKCIFDQRIDGEFEVYIVDNASVEGIRALLRQKYPKVIVIKNTEMRGFSENHNKVIRASKGEYVLVLNPDIYMQPDYLRTLLNIMDSDPRIGIAMGKLLSTQRSGNAEIIDSTGINVFRNRRSVDRGQGNEDIGQYDVDGEVFGASGAAMMCRREMLEDIKVFNEYYDEMFIVYKEDLDLAWRARLRGWKVYYTAKALAYHDRRWGTGTKRNEVKKTTRRESFKNRYLMLIKDDHAVNFIRDLPFILINEIKVLAYITFIEPHLWLAVFKMIGQMPMALKKRKIIMSKSIIMPADIRKWFI